MFQQAAVQAQESRSAKLIPGLGSSQADNLPQCSASQNVGDQVQATRLIAMAAGRAVKQATSGSVDCSNVANFYEKSVLVQADQQVDRAMAGHPAGAALMSSACNSYRLVAGSLLSRGCSR